MSGATCHVCGATIKVTRRDYPDPVVPHTLHAYTTVCSRNPGHVGSQAIVVGSGNDEAAATPKDDGGS